MAHHRFTAQQIAAKLEAGRRLEAQHVPVTELCRALGITELTYLRWQKKYAALDATAAARVRILEAENARLRRVVCGLGQVLKDLQLELGADIVGPPKLSAVPLRTVSADRAST